MKIMISRPHFVIPKNFIRTCDIHSERPHFGEVLSQAVMQTLKKWFQDLTSDLVLDVSTRQRCKHPKKMVLRRHFGSSWEATIQTLKRAGFKTSFCNWQNLPSQVFRRGRRRRRRQEIHKNTGKNGELDAVFVVWECSVLSVEVFRMLIVCVLLF
jgi:hypothetical protein